ncbi:MAG: AMP phosphorylase [Candidatus Nanoarchaeia archaeon]|nr:AMP phosphorylase [Candidatus Nanoarchaeia archaeon]MDD5239406.1 AMP phosphorylase [Candidatus Nanoarchaeia archaeon]
MFRLTVKHIDVETGGMPIVALNETFTKKNDLHMMDRVMLKTAHNKKIVAAIDTSEEMIAPSEIGLFEEVWKKIDTKDGDIVEVEPIGKPISIKFIRKKMDKEELVHDEINQIIQDLVEDKLTDVEMAAFVSACYMNGLSLSETEHLTRAIVDSGGRLNIKKKPILDKHCIGGVPGNRTTMVLVPIITSLGLTMPKTSSRAITSPAGTADTMEALCNVNFSIKELEEIVNRVNGCIVWGGAINLAAADDKLIKIRHPLSLDPEGMMMASILAKKIAVGATHIIFDLPIGEDAKVHYLGEARHLEREFKNLADKFKLNIKTVVTDGNEPIGRGIGPNLEARDVLWLLKGDKKSPMDLREKGIFLAGELLELAGKAPSGTGRQIAEKQLKSGAAYKQMQKIIEAQGGNPNIKPDDIPVGEYTIDYDAERYGTINVLSNTAISKIARTAGAPADKEAGIYLYKRYGEKVKQGEKIFTVYSKSERNIERVVQIIKELNPVVIK